MVHGEVALKTVKGSTGAFFSVSMDEVLQMTKTEFLNHFQHTEKVQVTGGGDSLTYSGLIVQSGLRKTRGDAKRVI